MQPAFRSAIDNIGQALLGKEQQIQLAITCLLANGHLLIEDLPGMGKTTLSHALAAVFGMADTRIQFTSDLLPADVLGVSIFEQATHSFKLHKGPIFNQLVLADEINRASPKSQSALLEAMEEKQVSIDGDTYALPQPFFVIATQNPSFQSGTYPLPESQLDRFLMRIQLGYPSNAAEKRMLLEQYDDNRATATTALTIVELQQAQKKVREMYVSDAVLDYILRLATHTRTQPEFPNALSPRAIKGLLRAAKAWAFLEGRDFVIPEDVQAVLPSVAEHRLRSGLTELSDEQMLSELLIDAIDPLLAKAV
ncbi:AAA family ATPase [Opacimonas viscosa]|uniref:MoxR family ATPase n=1 Tax=Opacimonas viscosa TaxID=2961944 RepID=A0AA41X0H2_9ALTE|nr:MoxR family ATPase [Opacimonas viscosa]MCP3427637.1 MoxR family ATPase [Opacimonas viscosa]